MTPEQKQTLENQIKETFQKEKESLAELKKTILSETDETKKQQKLQEIQRLQTEIDSLQKVIDTLSSLSEAEINSLKEKVESINSQINSVKWELWDLKWQIESQESVKKTPTTYEILKDSETSQRILKIIADHPREFKNVQGETPEKKLEYIFQKIRTDIVLFLNNKFLWTESKNTTAYNEVINNTIAPALERNLLQLLKEQWNDANVNMLKRLNKISRNSLQDLFKWVNKFAKKATSSYNQFEWRLNALDYLSVNKWILWNPKQSKVMTSPVSFQNYLNDVRFRAANFSPYSTMSKDQFNSLFWIEEGQTFDFEFSETDKQNVLNNIWNIQVVDNPKTTALITKLIEKPESLLKSTSKLQQQANWLLDIADSVNWVTKRFGMDIIWEVSKLPEQRSWVFKILDFVCKLIWITWGLEWIVKNRRLSRLDMNSEKVNSLSDIMKNYKENSKKHNIEEKSVSITDATSCSTILSEFSVTDYTDKESSTRWDFLRDSMAENMNIKQLNVSVVSEILGESYLIKKTQNWKDVYEIDESKITENEKKKLAHVHIQNMQSHLNNYSDLADFYSTIKSIDDIALCMSAALYATKNDVIEWVKSKVFIPETYYSSSITSVDTTQTSTVDVQTTSELVRTSTQNYSTEITQNQETKIDEKLKNHNSPITLDMIKKVSSEKWIPATYLAAIIENYSWSWTNWLWISTYNPWTVWNTDSGEIKIFSTREEWLAACSDVISQRIQSYKEIYTVEEWQVPPIWLLLANQWPDWKWFLSSQWNYKQNNPYNQNSAPQWAYKTDVNWPKNVESIVESYE